ncbi:MAG: hypothetical protein L3K26_05895, partial [Candidatus Hydrogenedentes bacterium]|nr:hypothetical protein [Candidatus Hydrogenedentota bacterium]
MPSETNITKFTALLGLLVVAVSTASAAATPDARGVPAPSALRGVFFNPQLPEGHAWLLRYPACRARVQKIVRELSRETPVNMVVVYVNIAYSMKPPAELPGKDQAFVQWANTTYLDNVANFVDDCFDVGIAVELDLASKLWVPWSVQPNHQIGNSPNWPKPDEPPWTEAAAGYSGCI